VLIGVQILSPKGRIQNQSFNARQTGFRFARKRTGIRYVGGAAAVILDEEP
jgi:hypothetical protein